jgi:hypothetical protein
MPLTFKSSQHICVIVIRDNCSVNMGNLKTKFEFCQFCIQASLVNFFFHKELDFLYMFLCLRCGMPQLRKHFFHWALVWEQLLCFHRITASIILSTGKISKCVHKVMFDEEKLIAIYAIYRRSRVFLCYLTCKVVCK